MTMNAPPRVMIEGFECSRCQHRWVPLNIQEPPRVCPNCKSPYWQRPRTRPRRPVEAEQG